MSIQESLDNALSGLKDRTCKNIKLHFLIHYPKSYNEIEWMNYYEWEESFPTYAKYLDDLTPYENHYACLRSWCALEDMCNEHFTTITSSGMSSFDKNQLDTLLQLAKTKPHVCQDL